MGLQEKADAQTPLGVYFHIPFCARPCDFCAFYQKEPRRGDIERYLEGMEKELALVSFDQSVETVFWGGGTPGLLSARDLRRLGKAMLQHFSSPPSEWTVEMAPSTVKADKITILRDLGVTRISLGVQSFRPEMLEILGRSHSREQIYRAIEIIRHQDFENLNLDLIFSIPEQSLAMWLCDLEEAVALAPQHISTYNLTFEEDTALWLRREKGQTKGKTETEEAAFFEKSAEFLPANGYGQYEISNYSRPGFACRHNLNTWNMSQWAGFGPSAASQYQGWRYANVSSLDQWLAGLNEGKPQQVDRQLLTPEILFADSLIFGLRTNRGVDLPALRDRFKPDKVDFLPLDELWEALREEGLLEVSPNQCLRLTNKGLLVADGVAADILTKLDEKPAVC